jgi:hypothetical protein
MLVQYFRKIIKAFGHSRRGRLQQLDGAGRDRARTGRGARDRDVI